MGREIDRRDFSTNHSSAARESELHNVAARVSNALPAAHRVRIERFGAAHGNPTRVISEASPPETGNYVERARNHLKSIHGVLGLTSSQLGEYIADKDYQTTSDGAIAVHLQQTYKNLKIFEATQVVRFAPDGSLQDTLGETVSIDQEFNPSPDVSINEAVQKAAAHVAVPGDDEHQVDHFGEPLRYSSIDLSGITFEIMDNISTGPDQTTYFEPGPFDDKIKAELLWFQLDSDLRLAWEIMLSLPDTQGQYRTMIDANDGSVLYCCQLMQWILGRGNIYQVDGSENRSMIGFPRPLIDYGLPIPDDLPPTIPDDWVSDSRSEGNNVRAHLGASGPSIEGVNQGGQIHFDPASPTGDDQKVLNIFYYNAYMHDFFYLLGFRERDGNFQEGNLGRGGLQSDRVDARAHSGAVFGTANMATPIDGLNPVMNMGLVSSTNRHTAFDSSVVFHEFMHGVTNRLVGGPANSRALEQPQSGGMGEGWGDYIACTINQNDTVGSWVVNNPNGIRGFRYDSSFPDHFGDLGTGRYSQVHNIGEIWCVTLLDMNRRIGAVLGVQLVVDALKLSPASPGFLDMRDAILAVLDNRLAANVINTVEHRDARRGIWAAFASFGMGPNAQSNGASLSGIVADFNVPVDPDPIPDPDPDPTPGGPIVVKPNLPIPDARPSGIFSTLSFPASGAISRVTVTVDIQHTYIGDLRVRLISVVGTSVELHSQTGRGTDNLVKTYTPADTPGLEALVGQASEGNWTLHVADLVGQDTGTLREWGLDIDIDDTSGIVRGSATPNLSIPDFAAVGVRSAIAIQRDGVVERIKVDVRITHTYIGDLKVTLTAPNGTIAVLHSETGGSADDLIKTYTSDDFAALQAFQGTVIRGNWTLHVVDSARRDVGTLEQWGIDIELRDGPGEVTEEVTPNLPIPDKDPAGITSSITVGDTGTITAIAVSVEIPHTYIGDLRVTLNGPNGTTVVLHDRTGRGADNLVQRYTPEDVAALANFEGKQGQGLWTLKVSDLVGQDQGSLQSWTLELKYA